MMFNQSPNLHLAVCRPDVPLRQARTSEYLKSLLSQHLEEFRGWADSLALQ